MVEQLFNPDNINNEDEEEHKDFNPELYPGKFYDQDRVSEKVQPKDSEPVNYAEIAEMSQEELLTTGPEPFARRLAELYARTKELEKEKNIENEKYVGILPETRRKYYQQESKALEIAKTKAILHFFEKLDPERYQKALEEYDLGAL